MMQGRRGRRRRSRRKERWEGPASRIDLERLEDRSLRTAISEFSLNGGPPQGITTGPDGALWFTEPSANEVGNVTTSGAFTQYQIPTSNSQPQEIAVGPDGALWFTEQGSRKIGRITTSGIITEFQLPNPDSMPGGIVAGPDGALWFTNTQGPSGAIGRISTTGVISEYVLPAANGGPLRIVQGSDGALWFTESGGDKIGRITTSGAITEFAIPTQNSQPQAIVSGPDGALWFTESNGDRIGRIATSGGITEYSLPAPGNMPRGIAVGPDGALWFTDSSGGGTSSVGQITTAGAITEDTAVALTGTSLEITAGPDGALWFSATQGLNGTIARVTTLGAFTAFPIPTQETQPGDVAPGPDGAVWFTDAQGGAAAVGRITPAGAVSTLAIPTQANQLQGGIAEGPDGALWFTETEGTISAIGRISPSGSFSEFPLPVADSQPEGITLGPDGALWFTETKGNMIGRLTPSGGLEEYVLPTANAQPEGITLGPDGALWFAESNGDAIGRITTAGAITEFALPASYSQPHGITAGPDGALWFTDEQGGTGSIGRLSTAGTFREYPTPTANSQPIGITAGPDGALWFTESAGPNQGIGRVTTSGVFNEYTSPTPNGAPQSITVGPDGALWFTEKKNNKVGRATTSGVITEYATSGTDDQPGGIVTGPDGALWITGDQGPGGAIGRLTTSGSLTAFLPPPSDIQPTSIIGGPDGALWFTESEAGTGGIVRVTTGGMFTEYPLPGANSQPRDIAAGPDGALWFTAIGGASDAIGRITTSGTITESSLPAGDSQPGAIVAGPDGALWFLDTQGSSSAIGRVTTSGTFTEFVIPGSNVQAASLAVGSDNNLWFTETGTNKVGRITPSGTLTQFALPAGYTQPGGIAAGADGTLWFLNAKGASAAIGQVTTSGSFAEYAVPTANSAPQAIAAGSGHSLWFSEKNANRMARIALTPAYPPVANPVTFSPAVGQTTNQVVAAFTDADTSAIAGDFTATIDWGDASTSAGTIAFDNAGQAFEVSGTHVYTQAHPLNVNVQVQDIRGDSVSVTSLANVNNTNLSVSPVPLAATEGATFSGLAARFGDSSSSAAASVFSATIDWGDGTSANATIVPDVSGGFDVNGRHVYAEEGSYAVSVTISDGSGTASAASQAEVSDAALSLTGVSMAATEGVLFNGNLAFFSDANPNPDMSDYTLSVDWGDGTTSVGTLAQIAAGHVYAESGTYRVLIAIMDSGGAGASATSTAHVADVPLANASGRVVNATEGQPFAGTVAVFSDRNPDASAADFSTTIAWGDGQTSAGTVVYNAGNNQFSVTGSHLYVESGNDPVLVSITDAGGSSASASSTATIADAALAATGLTFSPTEASSFSGTVASFSDANPLAAASDFSATITWGDGSTAAGTILYDSSRGLFDVGGSYTYAQAGGYGVSVAIADGGGAYATASSYASVEDAALTINPKSINATEGSSFTVLLAKFYDANPGGAPTDFTATIDWGDGTTTAGTLKGTGNGQFHVYGTHTYLTTTATASLVIADVGGATATASVPTVITDAPLSAAPQTFPGVEGLPISGVVASFTDTAPGGPASNYSATIAWGDGSSGTGSVAANGSGGFDVQGMHAYARTGQYAVAVSIADIGGATSSAASTAQVGDAPLSASTAGNVAATEGVPFSNLLASFTDANPGGVASDYTATIDWGDGQTSSGTVSSGVSAQTFRVSGSHAYGEDGAFPVAVSIADDGGGTTSSSGTAFVADAPLIASVSAVSSTIGARFSGTVASFHDADSSGVAGDYSATIDWGDGQSSTGSIVATQGPSDFLVGGGHVYVEPGSYTVVVNVFDAGGSSATSQGRATVADAPPSVTAPGVAASEGTPTSVTVATFSDPSPSRPLSDFSATIDWGDGQTVAGSLNYDANTQTFKVTGSHLYGEEGTYPVGVTVLDIGGASASASGTATVSDAPLAATGVGVSATEGVSFSGAVVTFADADPGGAASDYSATVDWGDGQTSSGAVVYDAVQKDFIVNGSHTFTQEGAYTLKAAVADQGGSTTSASSPVAVVDAPIVGSATNISAVEGVAFSGVAAVFTHSGPPSPSDFSATVFWGDGQTTAGIVTYDPLAHDYSVSGSHAYAEEATGPIVVEVADVGGSAATLSGTATVADAPLTASGLNLNLTVGSSYSGTLASFSDADPSSTAADFAATLTWGDGQTGAGTVVFDATTGAYLVEGVHSYTSAGLFNVAAKVVDVGGAAVSSSGLAAVLGVSKVSLSVTSVAVPATEGVIFSGEVAHFTDSDTAAVAGNFSATIDWGDGQTTLGTVGYDASGQAFTVLGSTTYVEEGQYPVGVTIRQGGVTSYAAGMASVADAPLVASGLQWLAAEGIVSGGAVAVFRDADPLSAASDFAATIDWGDGQTDSGSISYDASRQAYLVSASHGYVEEGTYPIAIKVVDLGGASASASAGAVVSDAPLTGTGLNIATSEGASFSGLVARFRDADPVARSSDFSATVRWGDGQTSSGIVSFDRNLGDFVVSGTHLFAEEGTDSLSVAIVDRGGATATVSGKAQVADAPLSAFAATISPTEGLPFSGILASFRDADLAAPASDYRARITWGDGQSSQGLITYDAYLRTFDISGSHAYAEEGTDRVAVVINDLGGASASTSATTRVADAPLNASGVTFASTQGTPYDGLVATFTDADPSGGAGDYSATIDWGGGITSPGVIGFDAVHGVFTVSGSSPQTAPGTYLVRIAIADAGGASASASSDQVVSDPPLVASGRTILATAGSAFAGVVAGLVDAEPGKVASDFTATIDWGDGQTSSAVLQLGVSGTNFAVEGSHTYAAAGSFRDRLTIVESGGETVTTKGEAIVSPVAGATLSATGATLSATEGLPTSNLVARFTTEATAAVAGDFSATIAWGDGTSSIGTVSSEADGQGYGIRGSVAFLQDGLLPFLVTIRDAQGDAVSASGMVVVHDSLPTVLPKTIAAVEGVTFSGVVATFSELDEVAALEGQGATIRWGDGQSSSGIVAFDATRGLYTVEGTHAYGEEGAYATSVQFQDSGGASVEVAGRSNVADAQLSAAGVGLAAVEGSAFSKVVATFQDPGPGVGPGDYSATITWGDGQASPGVISPDGRGGYTVSGSNLYAADGVFAIRTTIRDVGGASTTVGSQAVVAAALRGAGSVLSATEGTAARLALATFSDATDATPADFTASVDWGDGQTSSGEVALDARGNLQVVGTHTYPEEGTRLVLVTIRDRSGSGIDVFSTVEVADAPLSATPATVAATEGMGYQGIVASFSDANPLDHRTYSATITWADGSTAPGIVVAEGQGGFAVYGSHTFLSSAASSFSVTIHDPGGSTATVQANAVVAVPLSKGGSGDVGGVSSQPTAGVAGRALVASHDGTAGGLIQSPAGLPSSSATAVPIVPGTPGGKSGVLQAASAGVSATSSHPSARDSPGAANGPVGVNSLAIVSPAAFHGPEAAPLVAQDAADAFANVASEAYRYFQAVVNSFSSSSGKGQTSSARGLPQGPDAFERFFPTEGLWRDLDQVQGELASGDLPQKLQEVFGVSIVAYVGYVLLNSRGGLFLLSLLTASPLWKEFDPLNVLLALEQDQAGKSGGKARGGRAEDEGKDEESLQSLVGGRATPTTHFERRHVTNQPGSGQPHDEPPVRRTRPRPAARSRGRGARRS